MLQQMHDSNTQVIYLDETMFTFSTFRAKGWVHNRERIRVNDSDLKVTTLAVIAAISEEGGLIDYLVHPRAINTEVFLAFVNQISTKLGGEDFALFLDNLSVHKTKEAKLLFERLIVTDIFNVLNCPQFNGTECYFSQVKVFFKKLLLQCVVGEAPYDTSGLIKQSIESVSDDNVKRCVRYACA